MKNKIGIALIVVIALVLGLWVGIAAAGGKHGSAPATYMMPGSSMGSGMMSGSSGTHAAMMGGSDASMQAMHDAMDAMHDSPAMQRLHDSMPAGLARQCDLMHDQMGQMMGGSAPEPAPGSTSSAAAGHAAHHSEGA